MPQGGLDEDEDPHKAALRELYEETSIRSVGLIREAPGWLKYDLPKELVATSWGGRYRGQKQKWFALRFEGDEREIDVRHPGGGKHKPEFSRMAVGAAGPPAWSDRAVQAQGLRESGGGLPRRRHALSGAARTRRMGHRGDRPVDTGDFRRWPEFAGAKPIRLW